MHESIEQGEPTTSRSRTSWVWEITGWSLEPQKHYVSFRWSLENVPQINIGKKLKDVNMLHLEILLGWSRPIKPQIIPGHKIWGDMDAIVVPFLPLLPLVSSGGPTKGASKAG